ncbi:unnamed protein product [Soboliphyme baturini]|uniref:LRRCT domain-containing protein n=1 Tax=Soboliphyme baturini TaxID=241478 RepID=A0A183ITQ2_9BILA|nr:unnamed protein product [Soboliphyme baturini]
MRPDHCQHGEVRAGRPNILKLGDSGRRRSGNLKAAMQRRTDEFFGLPHQFPLTDLENVRCSDHYETVVDLPDPDSSQPDPGQLWTVSIGRSPVMRLFCHGRRKHGRGEMLESCVARSEISDTPVPFLPAEAFGNLTITKLTMSRNGLKNMDLMAFDCVLVNTLLELKLTDNELSSLPCTGVPRLRNLRKLSLRNNRIWRLPTSTLNLYAILENLVSLDLSGNLVSSIPGTTAIMPKLEELILAGNDLVEMPYSFLNSHRSTLKTLDLAHNQISQILALGIDLPRLDSLNLSHNRIANFSAYSLAGVPSLSDLNLEANRLSQWNHQFLCAVQMLRQLTIGRNAITSVPADAMRCLPNLQTLDISNGNLDRIYSNTFRPAAKLRTVLLNNNHLSRIEQETFSGMAELSTVQLSGNKLQTVEEFAFSSLPSLVTLDLSNNKLTTLKTSAFSNTLQSSVGTVISLQLCDNPWICDDEFEPFRQWLRDNMEVSINKAECQPMCEQPELLRDWPIRFPNPPPDPQLYIPELAKPSKPTDSNMEWDNVAQDDFAHPPQNSSAEIIGNRPPYVLRILLNKFLNASKYPLEK